MAYTFLIDKAARLIRETWTGEVTIADLEDSCRDEWEHPDYIPGMALISDFRESWSNISADEVLRFASWFSSEDTPRKHAIVVSTQRSLDLGGLFTMIRDTNGEDRKRTQLFFSYVAAESWVAQS